MKVLQKFITLQNGKYLSIIYLLKKLNIIIKEFSWFLKTF